MSVPEPSKITTPWANAGLKNAIPAAADPVTGKAGFDLGFPAINMTAKEAGGIPPFGQDFNGILFSITEVLRYMQAGGRPTFSADLSAAIGGYPKSALVLGDDGITAYRNTIASNTSNPNTGGAGWVNEDTALTPPQFDNDTSIATTEFVQRALGNLRGRIAFSSSVTLTAAQVGNGIRLHGPGGAICTLPAASAVPAGGAFNLFATSGWTIQRAGADTLMMSGDFSAQISFVLGDGESISLVSDGISSWYAAAGTATLPYAKRIFGASLTSNGYQKLPSGLIIQWGTAQVTAGTTLTVTMPISFPGGLPKNIAATVQDASSPALRFATVSGPTASQITLSINTGTAYVGWIAIGN